MVAYARRDIRGGAVSSTLSSGITNADLAFSIAASTGWPDGSAGEFFVVIDPGNASEEKILCTSRSGLSVTVATAGRGSDGSSASAHASGATAYPCGTARDLDEANLTVSKTIGLATAVGQVPVVDATNSFAMLQAKTSGQLLIGNGTTLASVAMSGDVTINSAGVTAIGASKITSAMITNGTITGADMVNGTVTETQLAASVAGNGLAGGAGTALSVNTDGVGVEINADTLRIKDLGVVTAKLAAGAVTAPKLDVAIPLGYLGYVAVSGAQTGISTIADLTGLALTVNPGTNRRLRFTAYVPFSTDADSTVHLSLRIGSTKQPPDKLLFNGNGHNNEISAVWYLGAQTGSKTYKLSMSTDTGTASTIYSAGIDFAELLIEDIGGT